MLRTKGLLVLTSDESVKIDFAFIIVFKVKKAVPQKSETTLIFVYNEIQMPSSFSSAVIKQIRFRGMFSACQSQQTPPTIS
jgi:hypothetical protein